MIKKISFSLAIASLLLACNSEPKEGNYQQVEQRSAAVPTGGNAAEQLTAAALEETNYVERVRQSFVPLQEEIRKAKGKVPGIGDVTVLVDEQFNLLIENRYEGSVVQTKVNLKHLNNSQGGMMLIPDKNPGEFPGLRILVKDGQPGVQILKDGKLEKEEKQLEIYLADRSAIERITPAVLQALNIANGNLPE